jgi:cytochrome c biogenesis protein
VRSALRLFSSLRLAIVLIILLIAASILGTLIPQGGAPEDYAARYGGAAGLLAASGLTRLYHSFWYLGLVALLGLNIAVCTLTRLPGKICRALRPRVETDARALEALKLHDRIKRSAPAAQVGTALESSLRSLGFRVRGLSLDGRRHLLARKRTAGLFGADVVHAGLLVLLAGGIVSAAGGFRAELPIGRGRTAEVPGAGFALRLDDFTTEYHPDGSVKAWKSAVTVVEDGKPARQAVIAVNHPLVHRGYSFYQMSYDYDWDAARLTLAVRGQEEGGPDETLALSPGQALPLGDAQGTEIAVRRFLPDFVLDGSGKPSTRSLRPDNPAALVEVSRGGVQEYQGWIFARHPDVSGLHGRREPDLDIRIKDIDAPPLTVLETAKDPGVPFIWLGCILGLAGLFLAFYWPPREIRAVLEESKGQTEIRLGGQAAKGKDRLAAEFASLTESLRRTK